MISKTCNIREVLSSRFSLLMKLKQNLKKSWKKCLSLKKSIVHQTEFVSMNLEDIECCDGFAEGELRLGFVGSERGWFVSRYRADRHAGARCTPSSSLPARSNIFYLSLPHSHKNSQLSIVQHHQARQVTRFSFYFFFFLISRSLAEYVRDKGQAEDAPTNDTHTLSLSLSLYRLLSLESG